MKTVGIFLFNNVEVLDFAGPFEVFSVASQLESYKNLSVFTFSNDGKTIKSVNGLSVNPDHSFESLPKIDFLVIPGGDGTKQVILQAENLENLQRLIDHSIWTMTVCSGSRILAKLGLLEGLPFCTHHQVYENLALISPTAIPQPHKRFIQSNEKLFTSAGISAGIDLSLYLLEKTFSKFLADSVATYMEYNSPALPL